MLGLDRQESKFLKTGNKVGPLDFGGEVCMYIRISVVRRVELMREVAEVRTVV